MMDNLNHITGIVKHLLEEEPQTRNSDWELYYHVCKMLNPHALNAKFGTVLRSRKEYGLPSIETVGRARRKVVEHHPELAAEEEVQGGRWSNEKRYREYARGCV